jgi:hypothetical protein
MRDFRLIITVPQHRIGYLLVPLFPWHTEFWLFLKGIGYGEIRIDLFVKCGIT